MMTTAPPSLMTTGQVAAAMDVPLHRVQYAIATRSIAPAGRVAGIRVFGPAEVDAIRAALSETAANAPRRDDAPNAGRAT